MFPYQANKMNQAVPSLMSLCVLLGSVVTAQGETAKETWNRLIPEKFASHPAFQYLENDSELPNVLLYGDSISIGYTEAVRKNLEGKANVYRLHVNGNHSGKAIELLSEMRSAMRSKELEDPWTFDWDVIHLNVGLHDIKYILNGKKDRVNGKQVISIEGYKKNLHGIVAYLKKFAPNGKLIFATTTPVPEGEKGRIAGDAAKYNQAAIEALENYPEIAINDLHSFVLPNHEKWWIKPRNVHYNDLGSQSLGDKVASTIQEALLASKIAKSQFVEKLDNSESQIIVLYGTSLTNAGQWRRQFAEVVAKKYGHKATVINGARSGSDSIWGLKNLEEQVLKHNPDAVFLEFSMNDAITKRGISIEAAQLNLETMIDLTLERYPNCEIILMSMNPSLRSGNSLQRPDLPAYYESYRKVAEQRGLKFIDNYRGWKEFLLDGSKDGKDFIPDSIHPNGLGANLVITPNVLTSVGISFEADKIPLFEDPLPKKKR